MTRRYAADTRSTPERSRAEISRLLERYGADQVVVGYGDEGAGVQFRMRGRYLKLAVSFPPFDDPRFWGNRGARKPTYDEGKAAWEREKVRRWRVLVLILKSNLEITADESGAVDFDRVWLPWLLLPDGSSVGDQAVPRVARAYETGRMPASLLGASIPLPMLGAGETEAEFRELGEE